MGCRNDSFAEAIGEIISKSQPPPSPHQTRLLTAIEFYKKHKPTRNSKLADLIDMAIVTWYTHPYPDGSPRTQHGPHHALRTTIAAQQILALYEQHHPELLDDHTEIEKLLIILGATYHDAANTSEVFPYEEEQAELFRSTMTALGFENSEIEKATNGIRNKETYKTDQSTQNPVYPTEGLTIADTIIQSADALEMLRFSWITLKNFEPQRLKCFNDLQSFLNTSPQFKDGTPSFLLSGYFGFCRSHNLAPLNLELSPYRQTRTKASHWLSCHKKPQKQEKTSGFSYLRTIPANQQVQKERMTLAENRRLLTIKAAQTLYRKDGYHPDFRARPATLISGEAGRPIAKLECKMNLYSPEKNTNRFALLIDSNQPPLLCSKKTLASGLIGGSEKGTEFVYNNSIAFEEVQEHVRKLKGRSNRFNECLLDYGYQEISGIVLIDSMPFHEIIFIMNNFPGKPLFILEGTQLKPIELEELFDLLEFNQINIHKHKLKFTSPDNNTYRSRALIAMFNQILNTRNKKGHRFNSNIVPFIRNNNIRP